MACSEEHLDLGCLRDVVSSQASKARDMWGSEILKVEGCICGGGPGHGGRATYFSLPLLSPNRVLEMLSHFYKTFHQSISTFSQDAIYQSRRPLRLKHIARLLRRVSVSSLCSLCAFLFLPLFLVSSLSYRMLWLCHPPKKVFAAFHFLVLSSPCCRVVFCTRFS